MTQQPRVIFVEDIFIGHEPQWASEPNPSLVKAAALQGLGRAQASQCSIRLYDQGCFHKLYEIEIDGRRFIMRVALPVDPYWKTISERATMEFVRTRTETPLPRVFEHRAQEDNALGFEWMLMEFMPGNQLDQVWRRLPMAKKEELVKQLATYQCQL